MTKQEALKQIEELKHFIEDYDSIGFKDDRIFLLSIEEYEKYKDVIPHINCVWWLRSPGYSSDYAAYVSYVGRVDDRGLDVFIDDYGVRPAIKEIADDDKFSIGGRRVMYGYTWIKIDKGLYITEMPISFRRFDKSKSNYGISEVRIWLSTWMLNRV